MVILMDIENIINQVRYKSPKDRKSSRRRSARESSETSVVSEIRSAPDLVEHSEDLQSNDYTTYDSDASQPVVSRQHSERDIDSEPPQTTSSQLQRRRARTISKPQVAAHPTQWPPKAASAPARCLYGHFPVPVYFLAYTVVPMHIPPHGHYLQPRSSLPQHQQHPEQIIQEQKSTPDPIPRGVRLPPLQSLRRAQTVCKRKPVPAKKRIRAPPVVHDYDHLSVEEAIRELARRDIYITDIQGVSLSKPNLIKLLQRADRNNNRGGNNSPKESAEYF